MLSADLTYCAGDGTRRLGRCFDIAVDTKLGMSDWNLMPFDPYLHQSTTSCHKEDHLTNVLGAE